MTENETVRLFLTHQEAHYLHAAVGLWTRAELRRGKSPHLTRLQDVLSVIVCDDLSQPLFVWDSERPLHVCDVAGCEASFETMDEVIAHERHHTEREEMD